MWLARQNRFRLEGEIVRDLALSVSGLLDDRIGGESIRPPLPSGVADLGYAGSVKWAESKGGNRDRRGSYISREAFRWTTGRKLELVELETLVGLYEAFNHHPGQLLLNTGTQMFGRPSVESCLNYGHGSPSQNLPGYVVLTAGRGTSGGASNFASGFLPSTITPRGTTTAISIPNWPTTVSSPISRWPHY